MPVQIIDMGSGVAYEQITSLMQNSGKYRLQFPSGFGPNSVYSFLEVRDGGYSPMDILDLILHENGLETSFHCRLGPEGTTDIVEVEVKRI